MQHILLYQHEPAPRPSEFLLSAGFAVRAVTTRDACARALETCAPAAAVVVSAADTAAGDCAHVRALAGCPIVAVCEHDGRLVERCVRAGADTVLSPAVSRREFVARLRALLPREGNTLRPPARRQLRVGDLAIDHEAYRVTKGGRPLSLTPTEFRLLSALARRGGGLVTHRELLAEVWGARAGRPVDLRAYVTYLRRKLDGGSGGASVIVNHRGVGYRLAQDAGRRREALSA